MTETAIILTTVTPVNYQSYLGCYVDAQRRRGRNDCPETDRIRGFLVSAGHTMGQLHDRTVINLNDSLQVIWQFPKYLDLETSLDLLGLDIAEQIASLLEQQDWRLVTETNPRKPPTHTKAYGTAWEMGAIIKGVRPSRLLELQIERDECVFTKKLKEPVQDTTRTCFTSAEATIDYIEAVLSHLPTPLELENPPDVAETELVNAIAAPDKVKRKHERKPKDISGIPEMPPPEEPPAIVYPLIKRVPLDLIRVDGNTQTRVQIDSDTVELYSQSYEDGADVPPVKLKQDPEGIYWMYDGFHRRLGVIRLLEKYAQGQIEETNWAETINADGILATITLGTRQDAEWECLSQNINHGLRRKQADIPKLIEMTLRHPYAKKKSLNQLCKMVKVDSKTFRKHWLILADQRKVEPPEAEMTITRGNQTYTMTREFETPQPPQIPSVTLKILQGGTPHQAEKPIGEPSAAPAPIILRPADYLTPAPVEPIKLDQRAEGLLRSGVKLGNEKYTPRLWIDFAEIVFGRRIDLDPATNRLANSVVKAQRIFTMTENGLLQDWTSPALWLNPPYSLPEIELFAQKLAEELPKIEQAMLLVNACTETDWFQMLAKTAAAIFFPNGRINFWSPGDNPDDYQGRNEYRQTLLYWGPNSSVMAASDLGLTTYPHKPILQEEPHGNRTDD